MISFDILVGTAHLQHLMTLKTIMNSQMISTEVPAISVPVKTPVTLHAVLVINSLFNRHYINSCFHVWFCLIWH